MCLSLSILVASLCTLQGTDEARRLQGELEMSESIVEQLREELAASQLAAAPAQVQRPMPPCNALDLRQASCLAITCNSESLLKPL